MLDECHRFTTNQLTSILAEARKYGLGQVLANQYTAQLSDEIREAIFGNVGTTIAYRVGGANAASSKSSSAARSARSSSPIWIASGRS